MDGDLIGHGDLIHSSIIDHRVDHGQEGHIIPRLENVDWRRYTQIGGGN